MVETATAIRDRARVGGLTRAAMYDGVEVTAKARQAFRDSFLTGHDCKVCQRIDVPSDLPLPERQRRADALHQLHYVRVRMARGKKKTSPVSETPGEVDAGGHGNDPVAA